jgi:hypothetical protein
MADLIRVNLHKSCYLLLTWQEYSAGLARGKAVRRREQFAKRVTKLQAERDGAESAAPADAPHDAGSAV